MNGLDEGNIPPPRLAAAGFFIFAVATLGTKTVYLTRENLNHWKEEWATVSRWCLNARDGHMPWGRPDEETRTALKTVAEYFESQISNYSTHFEEKLRAKEPGFRERGAVPQRSGVDRDLALEVKAKSSKISRMAVTLFGTGLDGTVAEIMNVGLGLGAGNRVSAEDVRGYRAKI